MSDTQNRGPVFTFKERSPTAEELRRQETIQKMANQISRDEDGLYIRRWLHEQRAAFVRKFGEHPNVLFVPEKSRMALELWMRSQGTYRGSREEAITGLILDGVKVMFVIDLSEPKVGYIHE